MKQSRHYRVYDPFIFAQQAEQVYYTSYPEGHRGWLAVLKIKARSAVMDNITPPHEDAFQDVHEIHDFHVLLNIDGDVYNGTLADAGGEQVQHLAIGDTGASEYDEESTEPESDYETSDETDSVPSDYESD